MLVVQGAMDAGNRLDSDAAGVARAMPAGRRVVGWSVLVFGICWIPGLVLSECARPPVWSVPEFRVTGSRIRFLEKVCRDLERSVWEFRQRTGELPAADAFAGRLDALPLACGRWHYARTAAPHGFRLESEVQETGPWTFRYEVSARWRGNTSGLAPSLLAEGLAIAERVFAHRAEHGAYPDPESILSEDESGRWLTRSTGARIILRPASVSRRPVILIEKGAWEIVGPPIGS